jgi:hypothetical protein
VRPSKDVAERVSAELKTYFDHEKKRLKPRGIKWFSVCNKTNKGIGNNGRADRQIFVANWWVGRSLTAAG